LGGGEVKDRAGQYENGWGKKLYLYMELEVRMNVNRFEFSLNFGWRSGVHFKRKVC
jgi:hypothetical protein